MAENIGIQYTIDVGKIKAQIKTIKAEFASLHKGLETMAAKVPKVSAGGIDEKAISSASAQLKKLGVASSMTMKDIKKLNLSAADTQRVFELSKDRMKDLTTQIDSTGKVTKVASKEFSQLQKRMPELEHEVQKGKKSFGDYRRAMDRWGQGFKYMMASQLAWITSGAAIFGTIGAIIQGLKDLVTYHQQMKSLAAITQANAREMELMSSAIRDAAVGTKFFAADMGKAATIMAQAGLSAQEVADSIGAVAVLASATGNELVDVADVMTTVLRAYDLQANQALRVANVMAAGISESKLQIDKLRVAMNYMGVAAHQFNISIEETVAWLGTLSDRGLKASTIGTSFRGVLAVLTQETDKFGRMLKNLPTPLAFSDITIRSGRKLEDAIKRLADAGFSVTDAFTAVQRRVAMTLSLMVRNVGSWEELKESITGTSRALEMNEIMMEGMTSQLAQTKSIFDEIVVAATKSGGALEPIVFAIKKIVQLVGLAAISISTFLGIMGKGIGAYYAALSQINWRKLLVLDFKGAAAESKAILQEFLDDTKKALDEWAESGERIMGKGGLFGKGFVLPKHLEAIRTAANTITELTKQADEIKKLMKALEEGGNRGSEAWKGFQGELRLLQARIAELSEEAGIVIDNIEGPILNLKDVMLDMTMTSTVTLEQLLAVFRTGEKDVKLLRKAVAVLEEQAKKALQAWIEEGGKGEEAYKRALSAAKVYGTGLKKLLATEEKVLKTEENINEERIKASEKALKERLSLEEKILAFRKKITGELIKLTEDEAAHNIWVKKQEYDERKKLLQELVEEIKRIRLEEFLSGALTEETIKKYNELIDLIRKERTELDKLYAIKLIKDIEPDPSDFGAGFLKGLEEIGKELANEYEIWKNMAKELASSMRDSLSDLFFDSMKGELKSLEDYWKAFTTSVKRMIADMAAQWVMLKAKSVDWLGLAASAVSFVGGISGGGGTGGGATAPAPGPGMINVHQGGFPSFHPGGQNLASNEILAVLKRGEFVIRDSSAKSIGVEALERMNRTGQMPQQPAVIDNRKYYNHYDFIDPAGLDKVLRTRGASAIRDVSLGSYAFAKQGHDPRVR